MDSGKLRFVWKMTIETEVAVVFEVVVLVVDRIMMWAAQQPSADSVFIGDVMID